MRVSNLMSVGLAALLGVGLTLSTGCVEDERYEMNKPVVDETDTQIENDAEEAWDNAEEGAEDAADAVTPDEPMYEADTPAGEVEVSKDPITGDTNVDVDEDE